jgi:predicted SnoaL-like aldol condensation-catalyzing enzyme
MSASEVHRKSVELFNAGQGEDYLAMIDPEVIDHRGGTQGDRHGIAEWRRKIADWQGGQTNGMTVTVEQNVSSGEFSVNRYRSMGTNPESGKPFEVTSMDMVRVRDGRIVEHWALMDVTALRHQLGQD